MSPSNTAIHALINLCFEMENCNNAEEIRGCVKKYPGNRYYKIILEQDGLAVVSWLGRTYIKMKEENNGIPS